MTMIMTGVANTGGRIAALNRFARCSGWTRRLKEPLAPRGYLPHGLPSKGRDGQHDGPNSFRREKPLEADPFWSSGVSISDPAARHMISHR
jgi:hypothetical protein